MAVLWLFFSLATPIVVVKQYMWRLFEQHSCWHTGITIKIPNAKMKQWLKIERIPGLLASVYIKATRMGIDNYYRPVAEEIVSNMNQGLILDLGTGPGYLPVEIVKKASDVNIIGIDLSRKLIKAARANAAKAGLEHQLTFEVGNSARLRFKDESFDMVISTGMLHSLKKPVAVFRETYRVLKNGGQAWFYDPAIIGSPHGGKEWKASLAFHEKFFFKLFTGLKIHQPAKPLSLQKIRSIIEATDFKDYQIDDLKDEVRIKMKKVYIST